MSFSQIASVVIPVFNKEAYLQSCFDSLIRQTIDHDLFEAIFIDDGSTDNSSSMLREFVSTNRWAKAIYTENHGVCAARNAGIDAAEGKYIFFLDPDDQFSDSTIKDVTDFFSLVENEVDLVTYPIEAVSKGKKEAPHPRYRILQESGVYDLNDRDGYLICQTTMNVCTRNKFQNNKKFDFKSFNGKVFHEDQSYITDVLLDKMKIGFCKTACYLWNKNEESVSTELVNAYSIFENTTVMYEDLFSRFEDEVPRYIQGLLANDIGWKMRSDALLPTYLSGSEYDAAIRRLSILIDRVDDDVLIQHPNIHLYHAFYFLSLSRKHRVDALVGTNSLALARNSKLLWVSSSVEVLFLRTKACHCGLKIYGFIKSPIFYFYDGAIELYAITKRGTSHKEEKIVLTPSSWSRCGCREITASFFDFSYLLTNEMDSTTIFEVRLNSTPIKTFISCFPKSNFSKDHGNIVLFKNSKYALEDHARNVTVRKISPKQCRQLEHELVSKQSMSVRIARHLCHQLYAQKSKSTKGIWIYTDSFGKKDNAWLQFLHDSKKDDGIARYYAANNTPTTSSSKNAKVIRFGSRFHKLMYVIADKLICSDASQTCVCPFSKRGLQHFADLFNAETVYLQHGVLWAHLPWYYSADRLLFDKIVVSTYFETENLIKNYLFDRGSLITSGMPRYDIMNREKAPSKKILVCPSWRAHLIGGLTREGRKPMRNKFMNSGFFKGFMELFNSNELSELLEKHDYELHFKLHPIFDCYSDLFKFKSSRIGFAPKTIDETDYSVVVTDYSSYSFDFVYLNRALIYYIPDEELFAKGINHYNELDIPLDNAFGEYAHTAADVVDSLSRILKNNGRSLPKYAERQNGFFLHYDNKHRERLYQELMKG